jgi:hypothetical protein
VLDGPVADVTARLRVEQLDALGLAAVTERNLLSKIMIKKLCAKIINITSF